MKNKKKAFTLLELVIVIAISSTLLAISTNWYIKNIALVNNSNNRLVDLQSGVSTSLEMIKNTLKKTTQVHLVGKNVLNPDMSLSELANKNLDKNYNYITLLKNESGSYSLVNIVYHNNKFESFPISAPVRKDNMQNSKVDYSMKLFPNDDDYKQKLNKNILNLSIKGEIYDVDENSNSVNPKNNKSFELVQDIDLQNVNQIMISKYLEGGIDEVTAIAYDNARIQPQTPGSKTEKISLVFAIDNSLSMNQTMDEKPTTNYKNSKKNILKSEIDSFIKQLNEIAKKSGIEINAYIYTWGGETLYETKSGVMGTDSSKKYIYPLSKLSPLYGPFKLGNNFDETKINTHLNDVCNMDKLKYIDGKNTGLAILQALEILNQVEEDHQKFFVLLTDGKPSDATYIQSELYQKNGSGYDQIPEFSQSYLMQRYGYISNAQFFYDSQGEKILQDGKYKIKYGNRQNKFYNTADGDRESLLPLLYAKEVSYYDDDMTQKYNNLPNTFDKAYIIGFSVSDKDKSVLGINRYQYHPCNWSILNSDINIIPTDIQSIFKTRFQNENNGGSIKKFLGLEGSKHSKVKKIETYDAKNQSSLNSAFQNITYNMGNVMGVFDGPMPLNTKK